MQILPLDYDPDVSFANIENRLQMLVMNVRAGRTEKKKNEMNNNKKLPLEEKHREDLFSSRGVFR